MTNSPETVKRGRNVGGLGDYLRRRHDPLTSLVLTVPVFLVYHLGILVIDLRNGVDLVSELSLRLLHYSVAAYVGATLAVAAGLVGAGFFLRKRGRIQPARLLPVLVESLLLAAIMTFTVGWATGALFGNQIGPKSLTFVEKIVMAAGAGFHEEIVFRVALFAGGALVLRRLPAFGATSAALVAALVSSLLFSAVHYVGAMGDSFTFVSFTFRFLSGLYLCGVYRFRGFATAVYTHALYDILVFFVF